MSLLVRGKRIIEKLGLVEMLVEFGPTYALLYSGDFLWMST